MSASSASGQQKTSRSSQSRNFIDQPFRKRWIADDAERRLDDTILVLAWSISSVMRRIAGGVG